MAAARIASDRPFQLADRHRAERRLVQNCLRRSRQMPLLSEQPGVEDRRSTYTEPLEQLRTQPRQCDGFGPGAAHHRLDVDNRFGGEAERHRVSIDHSFRADRSSDLRQTPAQRPAGIISVGEQQRGKLTSSRRPLAQDQVRKNRPALLATEAIGLTDPAADAWPTRN